MSNCNVLELFNNVTSNCDNAIEVVKDECKMLCLMNIAKALDMRYFELFNTALLHNKVLWLAGVRVYIPLNFGVKIFTNVIPS